MSTAIANTSTAAAFTAPFKEVATVMQADLELGLSSQEAEKRLEQYGPNSLKEKEKVSPFLILLQQFKSPFVLLLALAAGLSLYFGEYLDAIAILVVIIINAIIGFIMEFQAERSMEALKKLTVVPAKVVRKGGIIEIPSSEVVPGDILYVEAGDMVLADARIYSLSQLEVDESSLTGESIPVAKRIEVLTENTPLAERENMLYKGTSVTKGNGYGIVTATGMQTELGKIATLVQSAKQAATPLEEKIQHFSRKLIWLTVILIIVIFIAGVLYGQELLSMLETSIALAVAAIPEGLPIVATLALGQGMLRMARHQVIVKKLAAVETLGGTTVICTDKTGTLTQNRIEVNHLFLPGGEMRFQTDPVHHKLQIDAGAPLKKTEHYRHLLHAAILCNTADITVTENEVKEVGDPLETGLLKLAASDGADIAVMRTKFPKVKEEPFTSETKIMATCHQANGSYVTYAKGAVEELLQCCTYLLNEEMQVVALDESRRKALLQLAGEKAASGLRLIAVTYKDSSSVPNYLSSDLIYLGLIGMIDPPRPDVPTAIEECKTAGIKVVMITGDHPATAKNIGIKLGLLNSEDDMVIHGNDMGQYEELTEEKKKQWQSARIFARVSPKQKLDLVKLMQENGEVVGMTGDGVNDAPALKKADIGIAMGQRGTQVAQEVAAMVLKDDSFSSIVIAVKQGRIIFDNIRKFVMYLLSCNMSELLLIAVTSILNVHYALFPLQILFINLVTDVLPALALGVTEGSDVVMQQKPRNANEPIVGKLQWKALFTYSTVIALSAIGAVYVDHWLMHDKEPWNKELCNNILFITLVLAQLWHVFNITGDVHKSIFSTDVARNKYVWAAIAVCLLLTISAFFITPVAGALRLDRLSATDWAIITAFSILSVSINWALKKARVVV